MRSIGAVIVSIAAADRVRTVGACFEHGDQRPVRHAVTPKTQPPSPASKLRASDHALTFAAISSVWRFGCAEVRNLQPDRKDELCAGAAGALLDGAAGAADRTGSGGGASERG